MTTARLACLVVAAFLLICPLITSGKECQYIIKTKTGSQPSAGTKATVRIKLYDGVTTSGWRILKASKKSFQRTREDYFTIKCKCLGCITKIRVKHDNKGSGPAWYLVYVGVMDKQSASLYQTFTCNKWLKAGSLEKKFTSSDARYTISVYTANSGTTANAKIALYDSTYSPYHTLYGPFKKNAVKHFDIVLRNTCPVKKVKLKLTAKRPKTMRIRYVFVYNRSAMITYRCTCWNCLIASNKWRTISCKEVPNPVIV